MDELYPYTSAVILNDVHYTAYGGHTGTSTAAQRSAAYLIAEKRMSSHINTFLVPTKVTGTFQWPRLGEPVITNHGHLWSIDSVTAISLECQCDCDLEEDDACAIVMSSTYGYIYVRVTESTYGGCSSCGACNCYPWQVRVVYTAGLPSGTAWAADMLLALTTIAEITLNEMINPGANEGVGDIGVQAFSSAGYSESRIKLRRTALGGSARANYAADLVEHLRRRRYVKLGL